MKNTIWNTPAEINDLNENAPSEIWRVEFCTWQVPSVDHFGHLRDVNDDDYINECIREKTNRDWDEVRIFTREASAAEFYSAQKSSVRRWVQGTSAGSVLIRQELLFVHVSERWDGEICGDKEEVLDSLVAPKLEE